MILVLCPRKLDETDRPSLFSLHRPSPASCKSLMFRQVEDVYSHSPSRVSVLSSLLPSVGSKEIIVQTLGAWGEKELVSYAQILLPR